MSSQFSQTNIVPSMFAHCSCTQTAHDSHCTASILLLGAQYTPPHIGNNFVKILRFFGSWWPGIFLSLILFLFLSLIYFFLRTSFAVWCCFRRWFHFCAGLIAPFLSIYSGIPWLLVYFFLQQLCLLLDRLRLLILSCFSFSLANFSSFSFSLYSSASLEVP